MIFKHNRFSGVLYHRRKIQNLMFCFWNSNSSKSFNHETIYGKKIIGLNTDNSEILLSLVIYYSI